MANQNFEQILQSINNTEIRYALELLFGFAGVAKGNSGSAVVKNVVGDLTGDVTGNSAGVHTGAVTGNVTGSATKLLAGSAPVNAVQASGILTFTGVSVDEDIVTIGTDVYEINDVEGEITAGRIWVDLGDASAAVVVAALVAAVNASATEAVTAVNGDGDTVEIVADVAGVAGNAIVTTTDVTNASWAAAVLENGVDGTVGDAATVIVGSLGLYVAKAANTIADANWKLYPFTQYMGTGAAPQTIDKTTDLGETDFLSDTILLDGSTACVITDWTPTVGVTYVLECVDSTADPVVTLTSGITINSTGNDKMTFPDADDSIVLKMVTATRMVILSNNGAVTLATA